MRRWPGHGGGAVMKVRVVEIAAEYLYADAYDEN